MENNKIFKIDTNINNYYYYVKCSDVIHAKHIVLRDAIGKPKDIIKSNEIPENEWNNIEVNIWEDNNFDLEPYQKTLKDEFEEMGDLSGIICSNDLSIIN